MTIETLCAWHPRPVLISEGRVLAGPVPPPWVPVSHGICLACKAAWVAAMDTPPDRVSSGLLRDARVGPL